MAGLHLENVYVLSHLCIIILVSIFQGRKEDAEKKRLEALERKKERDLLAAQEESEIKVQSAKKGKKNS